LENGLLPFNFIGERPLSLPQQPTPTLDESDPLMTRVQQHKYLNDDLHLPISLPYFNKICLPSRNEGPPVDIWFGSRPLSRRSTVRAWAESRCSKTRGGFAA
jgi:hypothetical protein